MKIENRSTYELTRISVVVVCMIMCSAISVPTTVPFTLQTFGVFFAIEFLGAREGSVAICLYILLGIMGFPVFSGFTGGIGVIVGPTGGYIIGFILIGVVCICFENRFGYKGRMVSRYIGLVICYLFGTFWFVLLYTRTGATIGFLKALSICVVPFIIPDLVKLNLAIVVAKRVRRALNC